MREVLNIVGGSVKYFGKQFGLCVKTLETFD